MASGALRILQILRAPVGGLFRHVNDLTRELARRGHEIGVVADSLSSDGLTEQRLRELQEVATLGVHRMPMPRVIGPGDATTPLAIRRLASQLQVEVLHGHGAKGGLYSRLGRAKGRVALYTPHGGVLHFDPGSMQGRLFHGFERVLLGSSDAIVFESHFARDAFHRLVGVPPCPNPVVHNGLTAAEFEPVPPAPDVRDFLFIGEFRELKGIFILLEALASVTAAGGRPATLAMAGGGADFDRFKQRVGELGLGERVNLLGVRPARQAMQSGHVVVVPSLAESLPYVVMEAAAAGRPVIATRVGGIPEIFGPTAGNLVPPGDAKSLGRAMQDALEQPEHALEDAQRRYAHVLDRFSMKRMAEAIEGLYRQTLSPPWPGIGTSASPDS